MSINNFLAKLDKVRPRGGGRWMASCPCHDDRTPSMSIRDHGGTILIHCFSQQCSPADICGAINFDIKELFPPSENFDASTHKQRRLYHDAPRALEALAFESLVLQVIANDMLKNNTIDEQTKQRLAQAATRIGVAIEYTRRLLDEK